MSLNPNALSTLAQAKLHLGIPSGTTTEDTRVEFFINAASAYIEGYCDRRFHSETYTELSSGKNSNYIFPRHYPITAVTEVRYSDSREWTDAGSLLSPSDYVIADSATSIQVDGTVPKGFNNTRVIYTGGYSAIPSDLEYACLWLVEWYYRVRQRVDIGKTSSSKGDESFGVVNQIPKMITEILDQYKRFEFAGPDLAIRTL